MVKLFGQSQVATVGLQKSQSAKGQSKEFQYLEVQYFCILNHNHYNLRELQAKESFVH